MTCHPVGLAVSLGKIWIFVFTVHLDQPPITSCGMLFFQLISVLNETLLDTAAAILQISFGCSGEIIVSGLCLHRPRIFARDTVAGTLGSLGSSTKHRRLQPGICSLLDLLLALGLTHQVIHLIESFHAGLNGCILKQPLDRDRISA